uniref:Uncharacterized protein n=1 Tax=Myotis myotis TaxID=51298 RepID=A0A7J7T666_MYOMY|nr:hypothetical protein mMyoMyo1_009137 [Myotis myotis]
MTCPLRNCCWLPCGPGPPSRRLPGLRKGRPWVPGPWVFTLFLKRHQLAPTPEPLPLLFLPPNVLDEPPFLSSFCSQLTGAPSSEGPPAPRLSPMLHHLVSVWTVRTARCRSVCLFTAWLSTPHPPPHPHPHTHTLFGEGRGVANPVSLLCLQGPEEYGKIDGYAVNERGSGKERGRDRVMNGPAGVAQPMNREVMVRFPIRAHSRVVGSIPSRGHAGGSRLMFLSLPL